MNLDETMPVKRRHILALCKALGNPHTVSALEGDTVEDAMVELAAKQLRAIPQREVVAVSITHNGAHCGNVFTDRDHAYLRMRTLNKNHPDERRELVDLVPAGSFDMLHHLARQRAFSEQTFGPGMRTKGVIQHIRKELVEIEQAPGDLSEWIDVAILAVDGAWRTGATPEQIIKALVAKQTKNEGRNWPDWRTAAPDQAIEHDRTGEPPKPITHQQLAQQGIEPLDVAIEAWASTIESPATPRPIDLKQFVYGLQRQAQLLKILGTNRTSELDPYGGLMFFDDGTLLEDLIAWLVATHPEAAPEDVPA